MIARQQKCWLAITKLSLNCSYFMSCYKASVGIYVDVANIAMNGGYGMQFDVLREFACHDNGEVVRLNAYVAYDAERAQIDQDYAEVS